MNYVPPTLDMRPDGSFRAPPQASVPLSVKLTVSAILVAIVAGAIAFAALALWVFAMVLPVVVVAAVFAWAMLKFRRWRALRGGRSLRPF